MLRNNNVVAAGGLSTKPEPKQIDRALRSLAEQHAALDADEAHWLRVAEQQNVWPQLGYVHALEYLEEVFGYAPRTALERLRVARELGDLPQLEDALRCGELSYSVVRELTRVATPQTVERWLEAARGRRFRDVEQMVAGRKKGDAPDDAPDPALVKHRIVLELDGESIATWRQMRAAIEIELEHNLDDRALVLALGERILSQGQSEDLSDEGVPNVDALEQDGHVPNVDALDQDGHVPNVDALEQDGHVPNVDALEQAGRGQLAAHTDGTHAAAGPRKAATLRKVLARYVIHIVTCRGCDRVWQDGGGVRFEVDRSVLERAECNAITYDDEQKKRPTRTIPAPVERLVFERAQHRCQVPGCRSSKHLAIHHIVFRSHGGTHDPSNLLVLCDGHHRLLHADLLKITGCAPDNLVFTRNAVRLRAADHVEVSALGIGKHMSRTAETHAVKKHVGKANDRVNRVASGRSTSLSESPSLPDGDTARLACEALRQLGFKPAMAKRGVDAARARVGSNVDLASFIKEALRHCG